jgi:putative endonuclease
VPQGPRPGFWWVYVLEREDGSWYTGISTDPRRRAEQHKSGKGGARANKISPPLRLLSLEAVGEYPKALRREAQIKGLTKAKKRDYVADPGSLAWPDEKAPWLKRKPKRKKKRTKKKARMIGEQSKRKTV